MASGTKHGLEADGFIVTPIREAGVWGALRALRSGMRRLPGGSDAETAFITAITAITAEGRVVPGEDPQASVLLLGYRSSER